MGKGGLRVSRFSFPLETTPKDVMSHSRAHQLERRAVYFPELLKARLEKKGEPSVCHVLITVEVHRLNK